MTAVKSYQKIHLALKRPQHERNLMLRNKRLSKFDLLLGKRKMEISLKLKFLSSKRTAYLCNLVTRKERQRRIVMVLYRQEGSRRLRRRRRLTSLKCQAQERTVTIWLIGVLVLRQVLEESNKNQQEAKENNSLIFCQIFLKIMAKKRTLPKKLVRENHPIRLYCPLLVRSYRRNQR